MKADQGAVAQAGGEPPPHRVVLFFFSGYYLALFVNDSEHSQSARQ
jgi:hypothetical protein